MQLVDGKPKMTKKPLPKWSRVDDGGENSEGFKATHSLAEATYKLTGEIRDTEHKDKMRDLIIADLPLYTEKDMENILNYAAEDVIHLTNLKEKLVEAIFDSIGKNEKDLHEKYWEETYFRGRYSAHSAIMETTGYRIDYDRLRTFADRVPTILFACQREINELFPNIRPFRWNKKDQRFSENKASIDAFIREWCGENDRKIGSSSNGYTLSKWMKTDTGELSQSLEAFEDFFPFKHEYPKDSFGAQMVRYKKLKQSVAGFVPAANSKRKSFWDYVDGDIVRPYLNPFAAQSSRTQPAATGFLFLKPAWMRTFCIPPEGKAYGGIDYASQEFFISALKSNDFNMIEAYKSGDVYLAFAIQSGAAPEGATKASHKAERDIAKSTVLGINFLMSKYGLATKLSADTGKDWTEDEAQELIDLFNQTYSDFNMYRNTTIDDYTSYGAIKLEYGWFDANDNARSVGNVPIQGLGAAIMRRAVDLAVSRGCEVIFTLHDAIYIQFDLGDESKMKILADSMREAFAWYFDEPDVKKDALSIRLDPAIWSPEYTEEGDIEVDGLKIYKSKFYVDERGEKEYKFFEKYLTKTDELDL